MLAFNLHAAKRVDLLDARNQDALTGFSWIEWMPMEGNAHKNRHQSLKLGSILLFRI